MRMWTWARGLRIAPSTKKSGSFALPLLASDCKSLLTSLFAALDHDGPVERTGGDARNGVQQALHGEAPGRASEPTRPARNGVHFHNREDVGVVRRRSLSGKLSRKAVSVGRNEVSGPDFPQESGGLTSNSEVIVKRPRWVAFPDALASPTNGGTGRPEFQLLQGAFEGYRLVFRPRAGERRCQAERRYLQIHNGFRDGFHILIFRLGWNTRAFCLLLCRTRRRTTPPRWPRVETHSPPFNPYWRIF